MGFYIVKIMKDDNPKKVTYHANIKGARIALRAMNRKAGWTRISKSFSGGLEMEWCAKSNGLPVYNHAPYAIIEETFYRIKYPVQKKTVRNIMTGQLIDIDEDTPHCCDPSSETYWSM